MRIVKCVQGSDEWRLARLGNQTGSRMADVMSFTKKGSEGAERRNYRIELASERLTGRMVDHYVSKDMEFGTECEPAARAAYEIEQEVLVHRVGFVLHPAFDYFGCSPDGLVGNDGGAEYKCPRQTTHVRWMLENVVPEEHRPQMYANMLCCEREWWDFQSFCLFMPDGLKTFTKRMYRDEKQIAEIERQIIRFEEELEMAIAPLRKRIQVRPAPPVDTRSDFDQLMAMIDAQEMTP